MFFSEVVVIGGGIEGLLTAYSLRKRGLQTLILDQFEFGHSNGSSHGESRIIRVAYPEGYYYTQMALQALQLWKDIEKQSNLQLFQNTGVLCVADESYGGFNRVNKIASVLQDVDVDYEVFNPNQLQAKFPQCSFPGYSGCLDKAGGILFADKCHKAVLDIFRAMGGVVAEKEKVVTIVPGEEQIEIITESRTIVCKKLVVCAGMWTNPLLHHVNLHLPIEVKLVHLCYWPVKEEKVYDHDKFPCIIIRAKDNETYSLPCLERPNQFKFCRHIENDVVNPTTVTQKDKETYPPILKKLVKDYFPLVSDTPSNVQSCYYSSTPDRNYFLDYHPKYKNIVIGAGFSGHGFKMAPTVGMILSDLIERKTPTFDISAFRIDRFNLKSKY